MSVAGERELGERLTLGDAEVWIAGHLELMAVPGGVRPLRLPRRWWTQFPPAGGVLETVVSQPSGVRLLLATTATRVSLLVRCTEMLTEGNPGAVNSFVATVGSDVVAVAAPVVTARLDTHLDGSAPTLVESGDPVEAVLDGLPAGQKELTIWLPQAMTVDLLSISADAPIEPILARGRVWLHHGSSISHCAAPARPTSTWPVVAAGLSGLQLINLGYAGNCMLDPFVAAAMADTPADVITLKVGVNIVGGRSFDQRTFVPALHGFLDRIRVGHPDTPIVVISSILWDGSEDRPGPSDAIFDDGHLHCFTAGDPADIAKGALTMPIAREQTAFVVESRAALGEPIHYLDGLALYGSADAVTSPLPDTLHPDAPIYEEMGRRFARLVFSADGLVPAGSLG